MAYQYTFCPTCGTRRVAYGYRCSVCGGLVRRTPVGTSRPRIVFRWPSPEPAEPKPAERQPVAA